METEGENCLFSNCHTAVEPIVVTKGYEGGDRRARGMTGLVLGRVSEY